MSTKIDFATVLASSVHDMKNSLALVANQLEDVVAATQDSAVGNQVAQVHYETQRINAGLVQLLNVYRHQQQQMPLNIEQHYLDEIIEELVMNNELYLEQRNITLDVAVDDDCYSYCDRDLIIQLLNDIVINAMRYTADKLFIKATNNSVGGVVIEVADNGPGYPPQMLEESLTNSSAGHDVGDPVQTTTRTGLGLYFARQIAAAHERHGQRGSIRLQNDGHLGGSVFTLTLP